MARIRSIKPEFPQSESMGRVSRDARLTFVLLWTICDDSGRTRGASRMLASLLFPYDDDAPKRIDGWLSELERENCITRYQVDGASYVQVCNWLQHQKIDKPSASKFPGVENIREDSPNVRECSSLDQGSRIKDQGEEKEGRKRQVCFSVPAVEEVREYCESAGLSVDPEAFVDHYTAVGWKIGSKPMRDWQAAARNWGRRGNEKHKHSGPSLEEIFSEL